MNNILNTINIISELGTCAPIQDLLFQIIFRDSCTYCPSSAFFIWISNFSTSGLLYISILLASWSYWFRKEDIIELPNQTNDAHSKMKMVSTDNDLGYEVNDDDDNLGGIEITEYMVTGGSLPVSSLSDTEIRTENNIGIDNSDIVEEEEKSVNE